MFECACCGWNALPTMTLIHNPMRQCTWALTPINSVIVAVELTAASKLPAESSLHTYTHYHTTTHSCYISISDLICLLYTHHGDGYEANQDRTYSVTLLHLWCLVSNLWLNGKKIGSTLLLILAKNWPRKQEKFPLFTSNHNLFIWFFSDWLIDFVINLLYSIVIKYWHESVF